jgi:channel protein (hemolysin III family)
LQESAFPAYNKTVSVLTAWRNRLIWSCAIAGITLKSIFLSDLSEALGLSLYLGLGWLGLVSTMVLWRRRGFGFVKLLLLGGVASSEPSWSSSAGSSSSPARSARMS